MCNDPKMVLIRPELSLDFKPPPYIPKTIAEFLSQLSMIGVSEKELKLEDFIKRLEDEMRKIDAFKRELPISMLLINDGSLFSSLIYFNLLKLELCSVFL